MLFTKLGAAGAGENSHVIRNHVEAQYRRRGRPYKKPVVPTNPIEIREGDLVTLELLDGSEFTGGLTTYGVLEPAWIRTPQYNATSIYVRMPDRYGWVTKNLDSTKSSVVHVDDNFQRPRIIFLDLTNGTRISAYPTPFNRNLSRLFLPRHDDKTHVFVTLRNGICYTSYFSSNRNF